jgi:hypothetical protein
MRKYLLALTMFGGLLAVGVAPSASAAPVPGATAAVATAPANPAVQPVYYWHGRHYPYYWRGHYYGRRSWRSGRWYYY